jgi:hypothetical protein
MSKDLLMIRYGVPGKLDTAPKGTICIANLSGKVEKYIQTNDDENYPKWILVEEDSSH